MTDKTKNTIPNIWTAQENLIHFYKLLAAGLGVLATFTLVLTAVIYFRDPIIVTKSMKEKEFYPSSRAPISVEKSDVEEFTKEFLTALYVWSDFNEAAMVKEVSPYVEDALVRKIVDAQVMKYGKDLKGKKLSQAITFVDVTVTEDRVTGRFFRLLLIEGIPLVVPTEVTLSMIQGSPTRLNPMGVYISGIMEHEGAK